MNSSSSPYRIIAVCTGNICRSPMAEMMSGAAFQAEGMGSDVTVDSAGTTGYEAGQPIDPRAARRLAETHLSSEHHVARAWQAGWFRERDLILALDVDHYAWLRDAAPDAHTMNKVRMLRSFNLAAAGSDLLDQGIEDPWYGGHADFSAVWEQIRGAVPGVVAHVRMVLGQAAPRQQLMQQQVRSIS
ncbi:low molecular weight protein-tyrosine-phosphatase [Pseudarthrobacter raffinosi]|uniref:low molecular weight protein-tyrosine-phosphatase n=1 Tax=Pseudarthrobacter raffinosi TaxID=2953651 RepID=UPI002111D901|nr:low molecular weight protein-tyrosine-phosphatase [Pseudarthrobacter sp. MDT3-9]